MVFRTSAKTALGYAVSLIAFSSMALPLRVAAAQQSGDADRPVLRVPAGDSKPVIDGKLEEPCWKEAAATGPLKQEQGKPAESTTEAFVLRDAEHLYVGLTCGVSGPVPDDEGPAEPEDISKQEHVALLIDSNHDRNSHYSIILTKKGTVEAYWHFNDRSP